MASTLSMQRASNDLANVGGVMGQGGEGHTP